MNLRKTTKLKDKSEKFVEIIFFKEHYFDFIRIAKVILHNIQIYELIIEYSHTHIDDITST